MTLNLNANQNPIPVPVVTPYGEGVMTPDMLAQLNMAAATVPVNIYADAVNGNDANPGTQALPVQTFNAAVALLPSSWTQSCKINLLAGDYEFGTPFVFGALYFFGTPIGAASSPLQIIGVESDQLGTLTSLAGSDPSDYIAAVTTTPGEFRGASLRNLTSGQQAAIVSNTFAAGNTTFVLLTPLGINPGDQFVVTRPGTNLLIPQFGITGIISTYVGFQNIRFAGDAEAGFSYPALIINNHATVQMFNCEFDAGTSGRTILLGVNSIMSCAAQGATFQNDPTNTFQDTSAGLWVHNQGPAGTATLNPFYGAQLIAVMMYDGGVLFSQNAGINLNAIDAQNSSLVMTENSNLEVLQGNFMGSDSTVLDTVSVQSGSFASFGVAADGGFGPYAINGSLGNAITVNNASATIGAVAGTGNAGFGIASLLSSVQRVVGSDPTVTGTSGDTQVGTTAVAYGALPSTDAPTLSTIQ